MWGLCMQLVVAVLVLRWKPGYDAMKFASDQLNTFLLYSLEGAAVVFGDPFLFLHPFVGIVRRNGLRSVFSPFSFVFVLFLSSAESTQTEHDVADEAASTHTPMSHLWSAGISERHNLCCVFIFCALFSLLCFQVVPLVIYIGAVLGLFYYLGITQLLLTKFGWLMSRTFHTTGVESVSLVANLFFSVVRSCCHSFKGESGVRLRGPRPCESPPNIVPIY